MGSMRLSTPAHYHHGFTLVQVSIMLIVASILVAALLPGREAGDYNYKVMQTNQRMQKIDSALRGYMAAHGYRPCPADGQYAINDQYFGVAADNTDGNCAGHTPAVPLSVTFNSSQDTVVGGVVPTKTLGLPDEYAFDSWGRHITYIVDIKATTRTTCQDMQGTDRSGKGHIDIKDESGNVKSSVMYTLISHGIDGHGAWPSAGSNLAGRINSGSSDTDTRDNASVNGAFASSFDQYFVQKPRTSSFDDIVFTGVLSNRCCMGTQCSSPSPVQDGFVIEGEEDLSATGYSVASGDVDNDGIPDIIIGAYRQNSGAGAVYVVYGKTSSYTNPFELKSSAGGELNSTTGFRIAGGAGQWFGASVASGDVDGDGRSDLLVACLGYPGDPGLVSVLRQDPLKPGLFLAPDRYQGYWGPRTVLWKDADGDGIRDMLVADGEPLMRPGLVTPAGRFGPPVRLLQ